MTTIINSTKNILYPLLRYTPFIPAVIEISNGRWILDNHLLQQRDLIIRRIVLPILTTIGFILTTIPGPIFLAGVSCVAFSSAMWGAVLARHPSINGRNAAEKHIFDNRFIEPLKNQLTLTKDIDLEYLMDYYEKLSDASLIDIIEQLKVKGEKQNKDCWINAFLTNNVETNPEFIFFLRRLITLKQIKKEEVLILKPLTQKEYFSSSLSL